MRPCRATRAGTQAPPLPISPKPRGVPLPHRGYTFDSAGLVSVTQPTLGNNASEETTPLGGCTFSHRTSLPHAANDFPIRKLIKKVQCRWHRFPSTPLPRVASYRRQPRADKSTTPMVLVLVHRFPNKQTKPPTRNPPNNTNHPRVIYPNEINRPHTICPNETVGAVPVCPPERPSSGVSIPNIHTLCVGI